MLALLGYCLVRLVLDARPAFTSAGVIGFAVRDDWNPAAASAISGEVLASVPEEEKAVAYALGCTRWEMIRRAVLPHARPGIIGAALLGLGRAIGETIAVVLVIGDATRLGDQLFAPGSSLAAVIATSSTRPRRRRCTGPQGLAEG